MRSLQFFLLLIYFCAPHHLLSGVWGGVIKPFDVAALLIALLLLVPNSVPSSVRKVFLLFPFWYFLRSLIAVPQIGMLTLFFGVKFLEYLIIFLAIRSLHSSQILSLLRALCVASLFFMAMELAGFQLGPTDWTAAGRFSAQFGGPYELGAIAVVLAIVYSRYAIRLAAVAGVILSGAKASIFALGIAFLVNVRLSKAIPFVVVLAAGGFLLFEGRTSKFVESLYTLTQFDLLPLFDMVPAANTYNEYVTEWLNREEFATVQGLDLSTGTRIYSYILALKSLTPIEFVIGNGPGFFTSALDSSVLRVFVETGAIGIVLGWRMLRNLVRGIGGRGLLVGVLVNILFVDVFFSARFLALLFLLYELKRRPESQRGALAIPK